MSKNYINNDRISNSYHSQAPVYERLDVYSKGRHYEPIHPLADDNAPEFMAYWNLNESFEDEYQALKAKGRRV